MKISTNKIETENATNSITVTAFTENACSFILHSLKLFFVTSLELRVAYALQFQSEIDRSIRESSSLPDRRSRIGNRGTKRTEGPDILGGATKLPEIGSGQYQEAAPYQRRDNVSNSLRERLPQ